MLGLLVSYSSLHSNSLTRLLSAAHTLENGAVCVFPFESVGHIHALLVWQVHAWERASLAFHRARYVRERRRGNIFGKN